MSIQVRWHNDDHRLLIVQFTSHWTWNDFFRAKATLDNLLDSARKPVNCIFVLPPDVILPPDSIRNGKHAFSTMHEKLNHIVVARPNILIRTIFDMIEKQHPNIVDYVTLVESQTHALEVVETLSLRK